MFEHGNVGDFCVVLGHKSLKKIVVKNCVSKTFSVHEIPDVGCADFQRARATTPPVSNRLGMPTARHNRERALLRNEPRLSTMAQFAWSMYRDEFVTQKRTLVVVVSCWHSETIPHWRSCRACPLEVGISEIWNLAHGRLVIFYG